MGILFSLVVSSSDTIQRQNDTIYGIILGKCWKSQCNFLVALRPNMTPFLISTTSKTYESTPISPLDLQTWSFVATRRQLLHKNEWRGYLMYCGYSSKGVLFLGTLHFIGESRFWYLVTDILCSTNTNIYVILYQIWY